MPKYPFKARVAKVKAEPYRGYQTAAADRPGSNSNPLQLQVASEARQQELQALCEEQGWVCQITINPEEAEQIGALELMQQRPTTVQNAPKPERNDPCSCGSGKKYKKCCG